jgi:hypothetical protein
MHQRTHMPMSGCLDRPQREGVTRATLGYSRVKAGAYWNVPRMESVHVVRRRTWKCSRHSGWGGCTPAR